MYDLKWSASEKKLARRLYEQALHAELNEVLSEFKARAAKASTPEEMWAVGDFLEARRRAIDEKYDYRYSQLILVFSRLVREGRIQREQFEDLSQEKRAIIDHISSL